MITSKIKNEKQARDLYHKQFPDYTRFATANTASRVAFLGMEKSNDQFSRSFNLSNKYLRGSGPGKGVLKFNRAIPHHDLDRIISSWGSPYKRGSTSLDFLDEQETGFKHKGMVPTKNAYPGRNQKKGIKRALARNAINVKGTRGFPRGIAANNQQRTLFAVRQLYLSGFASPNSKQFIYLRKEDQFFGFREGMYQFTGSSPRAGMQFPHLKMIYAKDDKKGKSRKATNWMEKSSKAISQNDIDKIYKQEFDKAFTRDIKRRW